MLLCAPPDPRLTQGGVKDTAKRKPGIGSGAQWGRRKDSLGEMRRQGSTSAQTQGVLSPTPNLAPSSLCQPHVIKKIRVTGKGSMAFRVFSPHVCNYNLTSIFFNTSSELMSEGPLSAALAILDFGFTGRKQPAVSRFHRNGGPQALRTPGSHIISDVN